MNIVCVCEHVTRREIEAARDRGATTIGQLGRACGAGTGCGECWRELRAILDEPHHVARNDLRTATK